jgi:hypothetical protein
MNVIRITALVIVALFGLSSAALADISVCNDFRARIRVALASENGGAFPAAGWWAVDPKACRDVAFPFQGAVLYYTADSDPYREGNKTLRITGETRRSCSSATKTSSSIVPNSASPAPGPPSSASPRFPTSCKASRSASSFALPPAIRR